MRTLLIRAPILCAMAMVAPSAPASANQPPQVPASSSVRSGTTTVVRTAPRWGQRMQGRWHGGVQAPGGYVAYRRPVRGFALPRYWIQPGFYIANYQAYRLPPPPTGYGWSRYYDDAVMTDSYGRVYDSRSDIRWEDYEGGYTDDVPQYSERRDNGVGGAAIGAVVGGVAGNVIAGRGNRTTGTLIGAAAGAVAGLAIDKAEDRGRDGYRDGYRDRGSDRRPLPPPRRRGGPDGDGRGVPYDTAYDGHWTGTWTREDGSTYTGEYEGRFEGNVEGGYSRPPHWSDTPPGYGPGGYISGGYYYPAPTVTTITITPAEPCVTETVSYVTVRRPVRPKRRVARSRAKCNC